MGEMTEADEKVHYQLIHGQRRSDNESIGVGFGADSNAKRPPTRSMTAEALDECPYSGSTRDRPARC